MKHHPRLLLSAVLIGLFVLAGACFGENALAHAGVGLQQEPPVPPNAFLPLLFGGGSGTVPPPPIDPPPAAETRRPWPDTSSGIHVFNDQLSPNLSAAQWEFAATHYAGTQKMVRSDADRLRAINPNFLILHYRLGHGLGYRGIENGCAPAGGWLQIVEGDQWVQEWPGDQVVQESWFYHWPETGSTRVLNCDWGWYLMEIDDPGWRNDWQAHVLHQLEANDNDGLFMDSLSVPNYLGADRYTPHLPAIDATFEQAWAARIEAWLAWLQTQPVGDYTIIPNVGSWVTTRDPTDYSAVDGVMIEGFALWGDASPFAPADWRLQMNRVLGLVQQGKILIAQNYLDGSQERMFALASFLLIKGDRSFINFEASFEPEWWPEYEIPIGSPLHNAGAEIDMLLNGEGVYRRRFTNGIVLVNPTDDGDPVTVPLGGAYYLAKPSGGGTISGDGMPQGNLRYEPVTTVTLPPYSGAIVIAMP